MSHHTHTRLPSFNELTKDFNTFRLNEPVFSFPLQSSEIRGPPRMESSSTPSPTEIPRTDLLNKSPVGQYISRQEISAGIIQNHSHHQLLLNSGRSISNDGSLSSLADISLHVQFKDKAEEALKDMDMGLNGLEILVRLVETMQEDLRAKSISNTALASNDYIRVPSNLIKLQEQHEPKTSKDDFKVFLNNIPLETLDSMIYNLDSIYGFITKLRIMKFEFHNELSEPIIKKGRKSVPADVRKTSQKKKHKSQESISLKVNPPTPITSRLTPPSSAAKGGLNDELTIKKKFFCVQCGVDQTPEWRKGPYGSASLCNACGLFHSKLAKRKGVDEADRIMIERRDRGEGADRRMPS